MVIVQSKQFSLVLVAVYHAFHLICKKQYVRKLFLQGLLSLRLSLNGMLHL